MLGRKLIPVRCVNLLKNRPWEELLNFHLFYQKNILLMPIPSAFQVFKAAKHAQPSKPCFFGRRRRRRRPTWSDFLRLFRDKSIKDGIIGP